MPVYDVAYYEEINGRLHALLIQLDDRISAQDAREVVEYLDANELGLALELMAEALGESRRPLTSQERADMLALADRMQMDDLVPTALALCPER